MAPGATDPRPRILHPTDCGSTFRDVYEEVVDVARALRARVQLLHVVPARSEWTVAFQVASLHAFEVFLEVERRDEDGLVAGTSICLGPVAETIAHAAAKLGAPLIVMRAERRGMLKGALLGSPVRRLQRKTRVPLLLVRSEE